MLNTIYTYQTGKGINIETFSVGIEDNNNYPTLCSIELIQNGELKYNYFVNVDNLEFQENQLVTELNKRGILYQTEIKVIN
jgi:hypothetical protein